MKHWRSPSGALAILLWAIILLLVAFGCGNGGPDSVSLPNGYTLSSWDWGETWIEDRNGERVGDRHFSVAECQVDGNLFFGAYHDHHRNGQRTRAYFIIDTAREKYQPFMDKGRWAEVLRDLGGVENTTLVPVSTFAERESASSAKLLGLILFGFVLAVFLIISLVILYYVRANRHISLDRL